LTGSLCEVVTEAPTDFFFFFHNDHVVSSCIYLISTRYCNQQTPLERKEADRGHLRKVQGVLAIDARARDFTSCSLLRMSGPENASAKDSFKSSHLFSKIKLFTQKNTHISKCKYFTYYFSKNINWTYIFLDVTAESVFISVVLCKDFRFNFTYPTEGIQTV